MPFQDEGGTIKVNPPPTVVIVTTPTDTPTTGGMTPDGQPLLQQQSVPVAEAVAQLSSAITIIPRATAPSVANLPQNARPGQWFMFEAQPNFIYVLCSDRVFRALALISVG